MFDFFLTKNIERGSYDYRAFTTESVKQFTGRASASLFADRIDLSTIRTYEKAGYCSDGTNFTFKH